VIGNGIVNGWQLVFFEERNTCLPKTAPQRVPMPEMLALVSLPERLKHFPSMVIY